MTLYEKNKIASSFDDKFEEFRLNIELSKEEFALFDNGIFSNSMDEKWNIFVLDNYMYCARSWTNHCIYKVRFSKQAGFVILVKAFVTKNKYQYNSSNIQQDKILFLRLIQMYLGRNDLYVDPEFKLDLIKETLFKNDPNNEFKRSIGHNDVGLTRHIYDTMTTDEQKKYCDVTGWSELKNKISSKNAKEPLLSLYLFNKETNSAITYYFDKDAKELLGHIIIKVKKAANSRY